MKIDNSNLSQSEIKSIKDSFFHIYHSFLNEGFLSKDFVGCLFKWGVQLHITEDELKYIDPSTEAEQFTNKENALQHLFNLVFMIYLDGRVEDIELEVVTKYAEKIGFQSHIVNDLLKAIVTAPYDGFDFNHVKVHLREIIEYNQE
jgi:Ca2+-binding EF-hand superfamily protein